VVFYYHHLHIYISSPIWTYLFIEVIQMSEQEKNKSKKKKESIDNYKIVTDLSEEEIKEAVKEITKSEEFYKVFESIMFKYNLV